jgi:hypothetical protein
MMCFFFFFLILVYYHFNVHSVTLWDAPNYSRGKRRLKECASKKGKSPKGWVVSPVKEKGGERGGS